MIALLDTSSGECKLSIVDGGRSFEYSWQADRGLAKGLLGFLRNSLDEVPASFHDLTGIAVMKGPGSFTGLRIGLSVMNTLASELAIPIVGTIGGSWRGDALERLRQGQDDSIVLPEYGSEANITKPRK